MCWMASHQLVKSSEFHKVLCLMIDGPGFSVILAGYIPILSSPVISSILVNQVNQSFRKTHVRLEEIVWSSLN